MWLKRKDYEQLVANAAQSEFVVAATLRAETAEKALATERRQASADFRHILSMWLRHEKSFPLPASAEEKEEKKAEQEAKMSGPLQLNADQIARREAVRAWAKSQGFTQEDADKSFMSQLSMQVDE